MSVDTTIYVIVGADVGSKIRDRYPDWDAMYDELEPLMSARQQRGGKLAIVEGEDRRYTRVGLLLADPTCDSDILHVDVDTDPVRLVMWINAARSEVAAQLRLNIDPKLMIFTHCS